MHARLALGLIGTARHPATSVRGAGAHADAGLRGPSTSERTALAGRKVVIRALCSCVCACAGVERCLFRSTRTGSCTRCGGSRNQPVVSAFATPLEL